MKNSAYYILLSIISTIFFAFTLWKKRDNRLVALYLFAGGLTYLLEYFTLIIFEGYTYYPEILPNPYFDNVLGAVVSNGFTIPMFAVFIAGFKLDLKKITFIAAAITMLEVLFVRLNIYRHNWWTYYFSFIGAIMFYRFNQKWLSIIQGRISKTVRYISLFFSNLVIQASGVFLLAGVLNLYIYNVHWFGNPYRDHTAFATLYILLISVIFVSIIVFRVRWFWTVFGILLPSFADIILLSQGILKMSEHWSLLHFVIFRLIIFCCMVMVDKYTLAEEKGVRSR